MVVFVGVTVSSQLCRPLLWKCGDDKKLTGAVVQELLLSVKRKCDVVKSLFLETFLIKPSLET